MPTAVFETSSPFFIFIFAGSTCPIYTGLESYTIVAINSRTNYYYVCFGFHIPFNSTSEIRMLLSFSFFFFVPSISCTEFKKRALFLNRLYARVGSMRCEENKGLDLPRGQPNEIHHIMLTK